MKSITEMVRTNTFGFGPFPAVLVMVALVALPLTAAADERTEFDVPGEDATEDEDDRPTLGGSDAPEVQAEQFVEQREFEGLQLADEEIVRLRNLIENTSEDDPARAEYLYNLSEKYWMRSQHYENQSIEMNDQCFVHDDEGEEEEARRCRFRVQDMEDEADRLRDESVDLYVEIIRNYPNFDELDTIYFQLGSNMMDVGESEEGLEIFRRMLSEFPQTEHMPQVLLYFGDYHFDEGDMFEALEAYEKVVQYPDSSVYQYARYKMGWTYFNLDNYDRCLEEFLKVAELAQAAEEGSADRAMLNNVRNDIVRAYSRVGSPDQAIDFFQDLAPEREDWLTLSERLAVYYGDQAAFADSTRMYRSLISVNQESYKVIDYQYEIVRNQTTIDSYGQDAIEEIVRLMRLVGMAEEGHFADAEGEEYDRIFKRSQEATHRWATTYHREARRTQNRQLFVMAHHLYSGYLQTFPEAENRYETSFFHGELLFELEEWEEAAKAYERVLEIDSEGEYTEPAVLNTMLALLEFVEPSEERAEFEADFEEPEDGEAPEIPEPQELPEADARLMRATENYIEYVPDGERIVDVKYTRARTYFDYNHLEVAAEAFEDIAFNHSDHRLADISANLHLSALDQLQDFHAMSEAVARYIDERPIDDREFQDDLYELNLAIRYNLCVMLDEEEKWEEAAHCYVEYVGEYPEAPQVDMALYNAALDFERIHEIGLAIQVRLNLLEMRGDSEYAPETLFNLAGNYHAWAIYGEASRYYEAFVRNFPDHENAETALANASTFRQGLGEHERAVINYEHYIKLFSDQNPEQAAFANYQIAEIFREEGRHEEASDQYREYIRDWGNTGTPDLLLEAYVNIGLQQWDSGDRQARQKALDTFEELLEIYDSLSEEEQIELTDGADAAAQARFMMGEDVFEEAEAIRIESSDNEELTRRTEEKREKADAARAIYEDVIQMASRSDRPDWAIAAAYRIGNGFHDFAITLRESPVPEELTPGEGEQYMALLEDLAMQFEEVAVEFYKASLETSRKNSWFNDYSQEAEVQLAKLRPADYRRPAELRAQPGYMSEGFMRSAFLDDVEEDQMLEELTGDEDDIASDEDLESEEEDSESDDQAADDETDDDPTS